MWGYLERLERGVGALLPQDREVRLEHAQLRQLRTLAEPFAHARKTSQERHIHSPPRGLARVQKDVRDRTPASTLR